MPLPPPDCQRQAGHQRRITVSAFHRNDGLWDVEGHLTDIWPTPVRKADTSLPGGQPMHEMWLRYTLDSSATILAVQAAIDAGPYDAGCAVIAPDYRQLVGVQVARGYRDALRRLFGRTAGCTHMNELAAAMGTAALQALWDDMPVNPELKPFSIDGCHALSSSGPQVAKFYPRWARSTGHDA